MTESHETEIELSAYLDGEADSPAEIAALLRQDPAAARRLAELHEVSAHVRALRAPQVSPDFIARVMARVEPRATAQRPRFLAIAPVLALAAAVLVVSGVVWWTRAPEVPAPANQVVRAPDTSRWQDDEEVLVALEQLAQAGEDLSVFEVDAAALDPEAEELAADAALDYLASVAWYSAPPLSGVVEENLELEMEELSEEDFYDLQDWLVADPRGGRTS